MAGLLYGDWNSERIRCSRTRVFNHKVEVNGLVNDIHAKLESTGRGRDILWPVPEKVSDDECLGGCVAEEHFVEEGVAVEGVHLVCHVCHLDLHTSSLNRVYKFLQFNPGRLTQPHTWPCVSEGEWKQQGEQIAKFK